MERKVAAAAAGAGAGRQNMGGNPRAGEGAGAGTSSSSSNGQLSSFETPRMPVVFVLGGPGSGKITHSETLVRHRRGYIHVNMTEKMHQILEGTGRVQIIVNHYLLSI